MTRNKEIPKAELEKRTARFMKLFMRGKDCCTWPQVPEMAQAHPGFFDRDSFGVWPSAPDTPQPFPESVRRRLPGWTPYQVLRADAAGSRPVPLPARARVRRLLDSISFDGLRVGMEGWETEIRAIRKTWHRSAEPWWAFQRADLPLQWIWCSVAPVRAKAERSFLILEAPPDGSLSRYAFFTLAAPGSFTPPQFEHHVRGSLFLTRSLNEALREVERMEGDDDFCICSVPGRNDFFQALWTGPDHFRVEWQAWHPIWQLGSSGLSLDETKRLLAFYWRQGIPAIESAADWSPLGPKHWPGSTPTAPVPEDSPAAAALAECARMRELNPDRPPTAPENQDETHDTSLDDEAWDWFISRLHSVVCCCGFGTARAYNQYMPPGTKHNYEFRSDVRAAAKALPGDWSDVARSRVAAIRRSKAGRALYDNAPPGAQLFYRRSPNPAASKSEKYVYASYLDLDAADWDYLVAHAPDDRTRAEWADLRDHLLGQPVGTNPFWWRGRHRPRNVADFDDDRLRRIAREYALALMAGSEPLPDTTLDALLVQGLRRLRSALAVPKAAFFRKGPFWDTHYWDDETRQRFGETVRRMCRERSRQPAETLQTLVARCEKMEKAEEERIRKEWPTLPPPEIWKMTDEEVVKTAIVLNRHRELRFLDEEIPLLDLKAIRATLWDITGVV